MLNDELRDDGGFITIVREYRDQAAANKDACLMARLGFVAVRGEHVAQSAGIARIAFLGVLAAVFKPRARISVTYRGKGPEPTRDQLHYASAGASMDDARATLVKWRNTFALLTHALGMTRDKQSNGKSK